ncbi:hypothetical protein C8R44DRAFT_738143 [Mycena epipterygia]|nr:hypothetical protein C8R44DRAFT_738143 [Mycena epipterygia]
MQHPHVVLPSDFVFKFWKSREWNTIIVFLAAAASLHSSATLLHQNSTATHFGWIFGVPASGGTRILPNQCIINKHPTFLSPPEKIKLDETIMVSGSNPLQRNYQGPCPLVLSKPSKLGLTLANRQCLTMLNTKHSAQMYLSNQDFAQSHIGGASPILTAVPLADPFLDKIKQAGGGRSSWAYDYHMPLPLSQLHQCK